VTKLPDIVKYYVGIHSKLHSMAEALQLHFTIVDVIMTLAPLHYTMLSDTAKTEAKASEAEFMASYGPIGLRHAHLNCIAIFTAISSKFGPTKEFLHAEVILTHDRHGATITWNDIQSAYEDTTDFICNSAMHLFLLARSFDNDNWLSLDTTLCSHTRVHGLDAQCP